MNVQVITGDCRAVLEAMEPESIDCIVTSPPYWGLRDYGVDGQLGMEASLAEHIETMVEVFDACRRVLKKEGTCWLNYGDCYASSVNGRSAAATKAAGKDDRTFRDKPFSTVGPIDPRYGSGKPFPDDVKRRSGSLRGAWAHGILKPKDLCMIANRLAIALQDDGWWVRSEIIWAKPNPMPESIKDRPASSHEKIFLLTKSARYFYDAEAVREVAVSGAPHGEAKDHGPVSSNRLADREGGARPPGSGPHALSKFETKHGGKYGTRNLRNVWNISTRPFSEAHFATFPPELAERCIKAGCPKGGLVLDPFGGAGTTGLVADRLQRDAVLIELNPAYADMARKRIADDAGLFLEEGKAA